MPQDSTAPAATPLPASAYYDLLTNPPGTYGRAQHGASTAFTLRGSPEFLKRACNLFDSFGGETENGPLDGSHPRWQERREVAFRVGTDKDCLFFCMPPERYRKAVALYLRGQLVRAKGQWKVHKDADGNYLGQDLLNEAALDGEAQELAASFYTDHLGLDYRAIPEYSGGVGMLEHGYCGDEPVAL